MLIIRGARSDAKDISGGRRVKRLLTLAWFSRNPATEPSREAHVSAGKRVNRLGQGRGADPGAPACSWQKHTSATADHWPHHLFSEGRRFSSRQGPSSPAARRDCAAAFRPEYHSRAPCALLRLDFPWVRDTLLVGRRPGTALLL